MSNGELGPSKGNDYAIEFLKQLLTLAGAILALTITFLKDALGPAPAQARGQWLVPVGWLLLVIVIWTASVAIAHGARVLGRGEATGYVFVSGKARGLAMIAQWSFGLGLSCLGLFAIINVPLFFGAGTSSDSAARSPTATATSVGGIAAGPPETPAVARKTAEAAPIAQRSIDADPVDDRSNEATSTDARRSEAAAEKAERAAAFASAAAERAREAAAHVDAAIVRGLRK